MNKLIGALGLLLLVIFTGCGGPGAGKTDDSHTAANSLGEAPFYTRLTSQMKLCEDYNPYRMAFTERGIFYFVLGSEALDESEGEVEYASAYQFYYQPYDGGDATALFKITDGYVRDFCGFQKDGAEHLAVLWMGEEAHISEYDQSGRLCGDIALDNPFHDAEKFPILLALSDGEFVIGMDEKVYVINPDGTTGKTIALEESVKGLLDAGDGSVYATFEKREGRETPLCLAELDLVTGKQGKTRSVPGDGGSVFVLREDGGENDGERHCFVSLSMDYAIAFQMDEAEDECLIDMKRQSILSSQVQSVFGSREEIRLATLDRSDLAQGVILLTLTKADEKALETPERELYSADGRRIVRVAVPEKYPYLIELHATKYNQTSDKSFVEIEKFKGTLEDYLGKGNRPDVIVLTDHTEIASFAEKGILTDLGPLFEGQEKYSLDGLIPSARIILEGNHGKGPYAMTGRFQLLLHASDGTEYDSQGKCSAIQYLKWYDTFLDNNEVTGMGSLENVLYADLPSFYDESAGEAFFSSDAFKELMRTYKEITNRHKGKSDFIRTGLEEVVKIKIDRVTLGPRWYPAYCVSELTVPGMRLSGMPTSDGSGTVYMKLEYPMGIMASSECKEAAFDFVMQYCELNEYCWKGMQDTYNLDFWTLASFSVFERVLREEIYETEKTFYPSASRGDFYFTDEQKEQLMQLIAEAIPETKIQQDIYGMLLEEMDGFLNGNKSLDAACEILQNRVSLYMAEQR